MLFFSNWGLWNYTNFLQITIAHSQESLKQFLRYKMMGNQVSPFLNLPDWLPFEVFASCLAPLLTHVGLTARAPAARCGPPHPAPLSHASRSDGNQERCIGLSPDTKLENNCHLLTLGDLLILVSLLPLPVHWGAGGGGSVYAKGIFLSLNFLGSYRSCNLWTTHCYDNFFITVFLF